MSVVEPFATPSRNLARLLHGRHSASLLEPVSRVCQPARWRNVPSVLFDGCLHTLAGTSSHDHAFATSTRRISMKRLTAFILFLLLPLAACTDPSDRLPSGITNEAPVLVDNDEHHGRNRLERHKRSSHGAPPAPHPRDVETAACGSGEFALAPSAQTPRSRPEATVRWRRRASYGAEPPSGGVSMGGDVQRTRLLPATVVQWARPYSPRTTRSRRRGGVPHANGSHPAAGRIHASWSGAG